MSELLVKFDESISDSSGARYFAQALGRQRDDGLWEAWLEFLPVDTTSPTLHSDRETTQPNRKNLEYWGQGLTRVYLMGALERSRKFSPPFEKAGDNSDQARRI